MASKQSKVPEQTFETAIERLEQIVEAMESDKLPLEELLARYEEGTKLVTVCQEKLDAAERRIELITRNSAGKPEMNEFEPASTSPVSTPPSPLAKPASKAVRPEDDEVSLF